MRKLDAESHYDVTDSGCWLWRGATTEGYGYLVRDGRKQVAHRWFYERLVGPIPDGLVLDHICHKSPCPGGSRCPHRRCVNPDHLEPIDNAANVSRGSRSWQTHCRNGHEFTEENTRLIDGGRRQCIACQQERSRKHEARRGPRNRRWGLDSM